MRDLKFRKSPTPRFEIETAGTIKDGEITRATETPAGRPTMTLDSFDVIWLLGTMGAGVLLGVDASGLWFGVFGILMLHWFGGPLIERWLDDKADRNHHAWRKSVGLDEEFRQ